MKKLILTFLLFVFIANISKAQFVGIPDTNFRNALKELYPTCFNSNNKMDTSCNEIINEDSLFISNKSITWLQGIQYFKNLVSLQCSTNKLRKIPELPNNLKNLDCSYNQLDSLPNLPNSLIDINCDNNKLISFPSLPNSLISLSFRNNQFKDLPIFLSSLRLLNCSNNQIQNLTILPNSLTDLSCDYNSLSSLPSLPNSLTFLSCNNNRLSSLPSLPSSLKDLYCSFNQLLSLPSLPDSLNTLFCFFNQLTNLPNLPNSLKNLNCGANQLGNLQSLPIFLTTLNCSGNPLGSLPSLPSSLDYLGCVSNQLSALPSLPNSLTTLYCSENQLSSLPALPNSLTNLQCNQNQLENLPSLPNSINYISCYSNQISSFSNLPSSLTHLFCSDNKLRSLPSIPNSISVLDCSNNQLTSLPNLPNSLTLLSCGNNQLKSLPILSNALTDLGCNNNQLNSLPSLPSSLKFLWCFNNSLNCLPILPNGLRVCRIKNTNIKCLPNEPLDLELDTILPICTNPSDICQVQSFAKGFVYNDENSNGVFDSLTEPVISNQIISVLPNDWKGISDENGEYWVSLDTAINNTWRCNTTNKYATIVPDSYSATPTSLDLLPTDYNFGIRYIPNIKDLEATMAGTVARPGFSTNMGITANNIGTINQSNITIKLKKPAGYDVLATSTAPTSISDDTLFWKNVSIDFMDKKSFYIELQVPVSAELGTEIVYETWVNGENGDTTPIDNYAKWMETIRGSYDPNDKLVSKTSLPPVYDVEKDRLIYTIRFQNSGTDTAFYVRVKDEIPANLNLSTLKVLNASHAYQLIVRDKNIVEFAFPNILLPDSATNEPKSHGYVQFSIQPKAGLPINTKIENNAAIYFDYNDPIITNFATTEVKLTTGLASNKNLNFKLFPNPTKGTVRIELPNSGDGNWLLSDISGRQIKTDNIANGEKIMELNLSDLPSGTYFITIQLGNNLSTAKVMKMGGM